MLRERLGRTLGLWKVSPWEPRVLREFVGGTCGILIVSPWVPREESPWETAAAAAASAAVPRPSPDFPKAMLTLALPLALPLTLPALPLAKQSNAKHINAKQRKALQINGVY